jgi:hypothetical protein
MTDAPTDINRCQFENAWVGQCPEPAELGERYCAKHLHLNCASCGEQATHTCDATLGGLTCGAPVCDNCEHELDENGTNGFHTRHCKKTDQKYTPWYTRRSEMMTNQDFGDAYGC